MRSSIVAVRLVEAVAAGVDSRQNRSDDPLIGRAQLLDSVLEHLLRRLVPANGQHDAVGLLRENAAVDQRQDRRSVHDDEIEILAKIVEYAIQTDGRREVRDD